MATQLIKGDMITSADACELLQVSLPIFRKLVLENHVDVFKIGAKKVYSKLQILNSIFVKRFQVVDKYNFLFSQFHEISNLQIDDCTYDLRRINQIDGHGAISLICHIVHQIKKSETTFIHFICDQSNFFLKSMNFFGSLKFYYETKIFWDDSIINSMAESKIEMIKMPILKLGYKNAQKFFVDQLTMDLTKQGYSNDICAYIGWAIGELADNALTHAKEAPCFCYIEQFEANQKYLQLTIGDVGIGISQSLKSKEKYSLLSDEQALISSFRPHFSGRPDIEKRGKGLTDVLQIAMSCRSMLQVESNGLSYRFQFNEGLDDFIKLTPLYKNTGTIVSMLFIDGNFVSVEYQDVDNYIEKVLRKI